MAFLIAPSLPYRTTPRTLPSPIQAIQQPPLSAAVLTAVAAATLTLTPLPTQAVSGGGKDYATQNLTGQTFHGNFSGKDFSGGLFRGCDFRNSMLQSARFFKAELRDADLSGADLSFATIESAGLRGANLRNAVLVSSYVSDSILDAADIEGVDFTDALISPESTVVKLCEREDAKGVNPSTGVDTRESLMCPD